MSGKHFDLEDRVLILQDVIHNDSIRQIALRVDASPSSVSRKLQRHRILDSHKTLSNLPDCKRINGAPWICNGCNNFKHCRKLKYRYEPKAAQDDYEKELVSSRQHIRTVSDGMRHIDQIITPLVRDNHQSVCHVFATHKDQFGISRSTCYRYIDKGELTIKNINLPRRVRYSKNRKIKSNDKPNDTHSCRLNRDYAAFLAYIENNPDVSIVEMDSVVGTKGGKVLLTLYFRSSHFMLAFLRDANTDESVVDTYDYIQHTIGFAHFANLFRVVLTDNGSEFKFADKLEKGPGKIKRCNLFYCDSRASQQKGRCKKNHEYIRMFIPQGKSFDHLTQKDINKMMSHINSVRRDSLEGKSPFECLGRGQLKDMKKLGLNCISPDDVCLSPSIFKK